MEKAKTGERVMETPALRLKPDRRAQPRIPPHDIARTTPGDGDILVTPIQDVLNRLRAEFLEMPGLRLKREQVERLCGVDRAVCQRVLDVLVGEKFLCAKPDGHYARLTEGTIHRPQPVTADLGAGTRSLKAS